MAEPLRIGVLGLTHDHVWEHLAQIRETDGVELVGVADPNEPLRQRAAGEFGGRARAEFDALLEQEKLDAVYVYSDNATGADLAVRAAPRGLHVMIEKPIAADGAGADRVLRAAAAAGVRVMVNWPFAWWPQLQHALKLAREGAIGRVWQVRYRAAHSGPREEGCSTYFCDWLYDPALNGGGALLDYCCYGCVLACVLLGPPRQVTALTGHCGNAGPAAEDNAVLLMGYEAGLAVAEASWTEIGKLTAYRPTIHGVDGTMLVMPRTDGTLTLATREHPAGREVEVPVPPAHLRTATAHFMHGLRTGEPFHPLCEATMSRDAQHLLDAGFKSAAEGTVVPF